MEGINKTPEMQLKYNEVHLDKAIKSAEDGINDSVFDFGKVGELKEKFNDPQELESFFMDYFSSDDIRGAFDSNSMYTEVEIRMDSPDLQIPERGEVEKYLQDDNALSYNEFEDWAENEGLNLRPDELEDFYKTGSMHTGGKKLADDIKHYAGDDNILSDSELKAWAAEKGFEGDTKELMGVLENIGAKLFGKHVLSQETVLKDNPTSLPDLPPDPTSLPDIQPDPTSLPDIPPDPTSLPDIPPETEEEPFVDSDGFPVDSDGFSLHNELEELGVLYEKLDNTENVDEKERIQAEIAAKELKLEKHHEKELSAMYEKLEVAVSKDQREKIQASIDAYKEKYNLK